MEDSELKQALLKMIQAELEAMVYYQRASHFIKDEGAAYHFDLLAQEELEHARSFYNIYPDTDLPEFDEVVITLPNRQAILNAIDEQLMGRLNEQTALQMAMKLEEEVANSLKRMLCEISSPAAKAVIENNIESTLGHLELIKVDYQRIIESQPED